MDVRWTLCQYFRGENEAPDESAIEELVESFEKSYASHQLTFEIDAESCRLRGDDMEYSLMFDYGCEDKTTLTIKAAGSQEVTVTYRNGNVVIQSDTAFTLRQFAPGSDETERFYDFPAGRTVITSSTLEGVTWK